ncbi:hypothetical protein EON66_11100 [archaeon]|nr:MAG: hypothetical protein EON66_11100 [archaeon]
MVQVTRLVHYRENALVLAGLRFFRACVSTRDDFYNRAIVNLDLLSAPIATLLRHCRKFNLVTSAVLECLFFIASEHIRALVDDSIKKFEPVLRAVCTLLRPCNAAWNAYALLHA